jgi:toxin ParE1/3/4
VKVVWSPEAIRDRTEIIDHIWADNPKAAARISGLFKAASVRLQSTPFIGRPGAIPGSRELIPHPSYRLVYEVRENDVVWIAAIFHTSRQWPPVYDEDDD